MLNRCDFKYNDVFVKVFEDWVGLLKEALDWNHYSKKLLSI